MTSRLRVALLVALGFLGTAAQASAQSYTLVATLNARAGEVSLGLAAMVFTTALLSGPGAADIGWAAVPLGRIHDEAARSTLARAVVSFRT